MPAYEAEQIMCIENLSSVSQLTPAYLPIIASAMLNGKCCLWLHFAALAP